MSSSTGKGWVPVVAESETSSENSQSVLVMPKLPLSDCSQRSHPGASLKRESDDSSDELLVTGHIDVYQAKSSLHNTRKRDDLDEFVILVNGQEHKPYLMSSPSFHDNLQLGLSLAAPSQVVTEETSKDNEDCSYGNELLAKPVNSTD